MDFSDFCNCSNTHISQFFIIPLSVFLGFAFVSYFVVDRKPRRQGTDKLENDENEKNEEEEYESKYPYKKAIHMEQDLNKLRYSMTVDYTPRGVVILLWNEEDNAFLYWADNDIPYTYLQTVARKYVTLYNCRNIYIKSETYDKEAEEKTETDEDTEIDEDTETEEANTEETNTNTEEANTENTNTNTEEANTEEPKEEPKEEEEKKSVFVQMKKYNIKPKVNDDDEKTNKFIKKGKLQDYKPFPVEDDADKDIEFVSYSQFVKNSKKEC